MSRSILRLQRLLQEKPPPRLYQDITSNQKEIDPVRFLVERFPGEISSDDAVYSFFSIYGSVQKGNIERRIRHQNGNIDLVLRMETPEEVDDVFDSMDKGRIVYYDNPESGRKIKCHHLKREFLAAEANPFL